MTRVLMVADGAWPTGFERVARGIGTYLQASGKYQVTHRALGYGQDKINRVADYPYELKPTAQRFNDPLAVTDLQNWIKEDRPDVVLFIQDIWNQTNYLGYVPRGMPTVGYYPIDTPNLKWSYALGAAALTEAVPYTTFGARETAMGVRDMVDVVLDAYSHQGVGPDDQATWMTVPKDGMELHLRVDQLLTRQNVEGYRPIPHGIDHELFKPMDKTYCREQWNFPKDAFLVLSVGTNQFRKRHDITIRAFAQVLEQVPNALLVLHCMGGDDRSGWDLAQLARLYGVHNRVICTHYSQPELTDEQLVMLYNTADVHINAGAGEGWGLTTCEAALCGVPQLVPDWSATRELWTGSGVLLPVQDYRFEVKYLNTAHAILDVRGTAQALVEIAKYPETAAEIGESCRERALRLPTWDEVGAQFAERIDTAIARAHTAPDAVRLGDLRDARVGTLESELVRRDKLLLPNN